MFRGQPVSEQTVFSQCSALVYVIDAQDEPYQVRRDSNTPSVVDRL